jgi:hypothetical protein
MIYLLYILVTVQNKFILSLDVLYMNRDRKQEIEKISFYTLH